MSKKPPYIVEVEKNDWVFYTDTPYSEDRENKLDAALSFYERGQCDKSIEICQALLAEYPFDIDVLHQISFCYDQLGQERNALLYEIAAVGIGLDALPDNFNWSKAKLNWYSHTNRPFMRAYHGLGLIHQRLGNLDAAETIFSRLFNVHPEDALGSRYNLVEIWLQMGKLDEALNLHSKNPDDSSPNMRFPVSLAFIKAGQIDKGKQLLKKAASSSPLVAENLTKKIVPTPENPNPYYMTLGSPEEAYEHWETYGKLWQETPGAIDILNEIIRAKK
ncbi:tetratricopeptide repeat protein [Hydrogenovibrio marinus]|uniref:Uncharacterized protein n=1 Tax=Hydrogenovibrio marinus TaxID=28885 RepID=A0A066ZQR3_HYDMR|nr:tetratricopeptide repeat protein [Hydrogenovibrio marinus]KDN94604.1 hypothetical protein EI16_11915 [Hydrogenovibrio marinus]